MKTHSIRIAIPTLIALFSLAGCSTESDAQQVEAKVYKSPGCVCCDAWAEHLEDSGFDVQTETREDMVKIKTTHGISPELASCHTALIDGYVIEGHVPASDIKRLLEEKPKDIVGLTAPGMPAKSPGMQPEGLKPRGYDVIAIKTDGSTEVFAHY